MLNDDRLRLCVPLLASEVGQPAGLDGNRLAEHFGLAERFAVIDSVSGEVVSECAIAGYCPGPCHCPLPSLAGGVDALAGPSMGFRLLQLSRRAKLPVYAVKAKTLGELCREIRGKSPKLVMSTGKCLSARQASGGKA